MTIPVEAVADPRSGDDPPVVVKKYADRRLYATDSSSYMTLNNLADMVRQGRGFVVYDAKSGEDITRRVLTQIIVEEENMARRVRVEVESEAKSEAARIYDRIHSELAAEEARADRLLEFYGL
jgi:polyhydroxyalkanoate synthesis repressor PhaR